ncbi:MAG: plasmid mobilization relaxosome protein MobC [Polaribacter sp.]|uniref:plasmid mobilization protein n=1 Tax=Algibacter sp. TaxID=1872428 RepID=UPI00263279D7|nr:plasmid mobilization relaxosome protein MobC [Algibacter sp.]MDG1730963.1 plasmid mobilization relaxosome protein MobC [Algibacter sp.]MDG2356750.1 plasmid mobilization relaxosome protein MobC [Polaribacter sp.]
MKKKYTKEDKKTIVKIANLIKNKKKLAKEYNIHLSTLYSWISQFNAKKNKNVFIGFKITDEEFSVLKMKCKKLGFEKDISHYIRKVLFSKHISSDNPNGTIKELYKARTTLNKTGNNINQIAHYSNFLLNQKYIEPDFAKDLQNKMSDFLFELDKQKQIIDQTLIKI